MLYGFCNYHNKTTGPAHDGSFFSIDLKGEFYEYFLGRNRGLFIRCLHDTGVFTPGNKVHYHKKRVGAFPVYVYHILHRVGVLDSLRCVFAFISNNVVQQHYTGVQWNNTIHDN